MVKDKEFEMELLKRFIKDYRETKKRNEKSEIIMRYCKRRLLRRDFRGLKRDLSLMAIQPLRGVAKRSRYEIHNS